MSGGLEDFTWLEQFEGLVATYKVKEDYGKRCLDRQGRKKEVPTSESRQGTGVGYSIQERMKGGQQQVVGMYENSLLIVSTFQGIIFMSIMSKERKVGIEGLRRKEYSRKLSS